VIECLADLLKKQFNGDIIIMKISEPAQQLSFYGFTAKMIVQGVPHHYKAPKKLNCALYSISMFLFK
jgi:hypothetical protein